MAEPDPFTEIREALDYGGDYMPTQDVKDAAYAALERLEREAAERETALAEARELAESLSASDTRRTTELVGEIRLRGNAEARVREVEAERDEARGRAARTDTDLRRVLIRAYQAEATVARQAETLLEAATRLERAAHLVGHLVEQVPHFTGVIGPGGEREDDYIAAGLHDEAQEWRSFSAVLASPEAALRPGCRGECGELECVEGFASPEAAAAEPREEVSRANQ